MVASQQSFGPEKHGHGSASPDNKTFWFSVIAVVGCFLLFIAVVAVAYIPPNDIDTSGNTEVVEARLNRLEEMHAKEAAAAENFSWVNQPKGVVRIPIALAVELLPQRLNERNQQQSGGGAAVAPAETSAEANAATPASSTDEAAAPAAAAEAETTAK